MNSRVIRILIVAIAIAIGLTSAYFLKTIDSDINGHRTSAEMRCADRRRRFSRRLPTCAPGSLHMSRAVRARRSGSSHVESLMPELQRQAAEFGASLRSPSAQSAFAPATAALENFRTLDAKVREFVLSGSALLAADMIFSDGVESTATAADASDCGASTKSFSTETAASRPLRNRELAVLGGGAGVMLLLMVGLAFTGGATRKATGR